MEFFFFFVIKNSEKLWIIRTIPSYAINHYLGFYFIIRFKHYYMLTLRSDIKTFYCVFFFFSLKRFLGIPNKKFSYLGGCFLLFLMVSTSFTTGKNN